MGCFRMTARIAAWRVIFSCIRSGGLYIATWIVMSTLLALSLLVAGALRATADSTAQDALPFTLPALLPFLGLALARWQRWRGQADEAAMRDWLIALQ